MFARSAIVSSLVVLGVMLTVAGCQPGDQPDNPKAANSGVVVGSCSDALGSTWTVTPSSATVAPGGRVHLQVNRNGAKYQSGPGAALVEYDAPLGGTLADPDGIETDYAAGQIAGDYPVNVTITDPATRATTCSLTAIIHVVVGAPQNQQGTPGTTDGPAPQAPDAPANATHADLSGTWLFSGDANTADTPSPVLTLGGVSADSVTVGYDGKDGMSCGCNAEHKVIPLGQSFDCSNTTLAFDYASNGSYGYTSNQAVSIRFCKDGNCSEDSFYGGDEYKASQQTGHSNCGWEWDNTLPAAQLAGGHNVIDLGKLSKSVNGSCSGSFDTIDVHLEAYACFANQDQGSQTLSNVVVYPTTPAQK